MEETPWTAEPRPVGRRVSDLQKNAGLSPLVAWLLVQRGIETVDAAGKFLNPDADDLIDPSAMKDMEAGKRKPI